MEGFDASQSTACQTKVCHDGANRMHVISDYLPRPRTKAVDTPVVFVHYAFREPSAVAICVQTNRSDSERHDKMTDFLRGGVQLIESISVSPTYSFLTSTLWPK